MYGLHDAIFGRQYFTGETELLNHSLTQHSVQEFYFNLALVVGFKYLDGSN